MNELSIEYHGNTKKVLIEDRDIEEVKELLNKYAKPTRVEIKSDIAKFIIDGIFWYVTGKIFDKILDEINKIINKNKNSPR